MKVDPTSFLKAILEIYSPSRLEGDLANYLRRQMNELGLHVRMDEVGNIVGEVGSGDPVLLLCGHMDTVPGFLDVRIEGGRVFGRGAVDAKSSLAAMILAASELVDEKPSGKIIMACVVDEEGKSVGMRNLLKEGLDVKYAIFGEPSYARHIVVGYRGSATFAIECESPPTHIAEPQFVSAIDKSLELWEKVRKDLQRREKSLFHSVSPCLTMIRGRVGGALLGERWCEMAVNVRFPPGLTSLDIDSELGDIVEQFRLANPTLTVRKQLIDSCEPISSKKSSLIVRSLTRAVRRVTGSKPRITVKTGSSDMNLLEGTPIHGVSFGPGDPLLEHTDLESVNVEEYTQSIEIYKAAIRELIKLEGKTSK